MEAVLAAVTSTGYFCPGTISYPHELKQELETALASRYRIVHELGRGGMATVYLSDDLRHDRRVAVKVLHPELSSSLVRTFDA